MLFSFLKQDTVDLHEPKSQRQYDQMRQKYLCKVGIKISFKGPFRICYFVIHNRTFFHDKVRNACVAGVSLISGIISRARALLLMRHHGIVTITITIFIMIVNIIILSGRARALLQMAIMGLLSSPSS